MATFFSFVVLFYFQELAACEHIITVAEYLTIVKRLSGDSKFETMKSALRFLLKLLSSL